MGKEFVATAWNNGHSGYGLRISAADRDAFLKRGWGSIDLYLAGKVNPAKVNVNKDSLWIGTCRELISGDIGAWMIARGLAPWPKGRPPKFKLVVRAEREFDVTPFEILN